MISSWEFLTKKGLGRRYFVELDVDHRITSNYHYQDKPNICTIIEDTGKEDIELNTRRETEKREESCGSRVREI